MTQFIHRLLVICPAAKATIVATWLNANVDPNFCDPTLGPGLNASGLSTDPVTHNWMSAGLKDSDCAKVLAKLCQLAGVTPFTAAQWAGWTQATKIAWHKSVQSAIQTGYGVRVGLCRNDADWDDPQGHLAALGLQAISTRVP